MKQKWSFVIAAAALAALSGGIAYATIPDDQAVIHACYARSGGALRVLDASVTNCKASETSLNWNQAGVPGQAGPQGPTGPTGPQGAPGPGTDVIAGFYDGPVDLPVFTTPFQPLPIAELPLPPGKYLIEATVDLNNLFPTVDDAVTCELHAGADFDRASPTMNAPAPSSGIAFASTRVALMVVHQFDTPGVAEMRCGHLAGVEQGQWRFLKITAIRVATASNGLLTLLP
jgi:hypothetical protein